ncbi:LPS export ABC transporter permease LptF [Pseudogemmobacter faecipullorum]|uniref:LPS export ABC transporter permease LptF n=1 Tax=Pseudogemmobacter faecipullorum TaxID=2755041 RepID=A0ABS8CL17_9RHOB|nr:LPS export ABC transporter permease LptF [Pseudogemmobacter faecipullorum]MCB5410092.1 LPS export ABC transporter permease LptF [Pseudogemmobacter faecipullorum]
MSKFDRYLLSQFLALFGFFSLVLVAVYWVNRAVGLFDQLIGDGQTALVFVEFSLLTLPNVIRLVLPVSAFAGCLYAVNRLMQESELVVMQATGFSAFRLARPVFFFGLCVFAMQMMLTNFLVPMSQARLSERSAEISENITARFLNEGRFMHPANGITLYIREISQLGELNDIFLADDRSENERITYTARQALIVRGEEGPRLVMLDGMVQRFSLDGQRRLSLTRFADFTLDMSDIVGVSRGRGLSLREAGTPDLLRASPALQAATGASPAQLLEEGHGRISSALLGLAAPLLGFAALMLGGYSRFGLWRQIAIAVLLIITMQMINTAASGQALKSAALWPLVYAAPFAGLGLSALLLWWAGRPRRRPRQTGPLSQGDAAPGAAE